ncbi:hypothetical protein MGWOODY_Mmi211 [hydrothermal vent metagenome]|uniref:Uncharacterized protein n=1 Tax=hydrothermal vent metagenome TaxID=652676 RepID=A0A160VK11_9ZZZZ
MYGLFGSSGFNGSRSEQLNIKYIKQITVVLLFIFNITINE